MISSNVILPVKVFPVKVCVPVDVPEELRSLTQHIRIPNTCELSTLPYFPILVRQMARNWTDGRKIREELGFWNILPLNLDGQLCLREREIWIQMRCQHQKGKCRPTSLKLRYRISFLIFCWKKYSIFSTDLFSLPHPPAILSYTTRLLSQILRHRGSVSNLFKLKKKLYFFLLKPGFYHLVLLLRV